MTFNLPHHLLRVQFLREVLHVANRLGNHARMKIVVLLHWIRFPLADLLWRGDWCEYLVDTLLLHFNKLLDELNGLVTFPFKNIVHDFGLDSLLEGGELEQAALDGHLNDFP